MAVQVEALIEGWKLQFAASYRGPAGIAGLATLVAPPSAIGADVTVNVGVGLQFADHLEHFRPTIVSHRVHAPDPFGTAVPTFASTTIRAGRTIKPDLEDWPVACEQFSKLTVEVAHIPGPPVIRVVAVPRREIDAELQPMP